MKFFFADHFDIIDPSYDFTKETGPLAYGHQQKKLYAHEVFEEVPYHGLLISKNLTLGTDARCSPSQAVRLMYSGARRYLRLEEVKSLFRLEVMGDSGAYSRTFRDQLYNVPQDEVLEIIQFYSACEVDYGLAPDNVVAGYFSDHSTSTKKKPLREWQSRLDRTLQLAQAFYSLHRRHKCPWIPLGVAQGWNARTYQESVIALQEMGYSYIALGGLAFLPTKDLLECIAGSAGARSHNTQFHLLGATRVEHLDEMSACGITSFDTTMPIKQAIKDDLHNYHTATKRYLAIRVPDTERSPKIQKLIAKGLVDVKDAKEAEREALAALRAFDKGHLSVNETLAVLHNGSRIRKEQDFTSFYRELLTDMPWKQCPCAICREVGVEVVLFRGFERNIRRGFHNLYVLSKQLRKVFPAAWS